MLLRCGNSLKKLRVAGNLVLGLGLWIFIGGWIPSIVWGAPKAKVQSKAKVLKAPSSQQTTSAKEEEADSSSDTQVLSGFLAEVGGADPVQLPLLHLARVEDFVLKNAIVAKTQERKDAPARHLTLYRDGAVVSQTVPTREIHRQGRFILPHLSSAVEEASLIFRPPGETTVLDYWFEDEAERPYPVSQGTPSRPTSRALYFNVTEAELKEEDLWKIQYTVGGLSWSTDHRIELSSDHSHILFSTILTVRNQSGIDFKEAQLQFVERSLPESGEAEAAQADLEIPAYRYSVPVDLPAFQDRKIIWVQARRLTLSRCCGLFVGGEFLQKMEGPAVPPLESAISFPNVKGVGLGQSLPGGCVTLYHYREGFLSRLGFTTLSPVDKDSDIIVRLPAAMVHAVSPEGKIQALRPEGSLEVQLVQESYRELNVTLAEADYRLTLRNPQESPLALSVTLDAKKGQQYAVVRSNIAPTFNKNGEAVWSLEVPAQGSRELRYKLTLRTR